MLKNIVLLQIEDPEDNWPTDMNVTNANQSNGPPPAKKKKYRSYDIVLENASDGGMFPIVVFL